MTFGITNQCKDNLLIPFFDFDTNDYAMILIELRQIQSKFNLSNIYILKSTNGYNAFSLDKLCFNVLRDIYSKSKLIDVEFIKWGINRGFMTLRMGDDKQHLYTIVSDFCKYEKSLPHKKFFSEIMEFKIFDTFNFDNEKQITLSMFPSNKYGISKEVMY